MTTNQKMSDSPSQFLFLFLWIIADSSSSAPKTKLLINWLSEISVESISLKKNRLILNVVILTNISSKKHQRNMRNE